ncbi:MAG: hypothetical protein IT452_21070 [Planctomycetia bacterium]|nr:hypothetical protein [Planctomycetia bacterium]
MTSYHKAALICTVCGKESEHLVLMSTNMMEPPDLDSRPGEMQRSTMDCWVQECQSCGYCAQHISEITSRAVADILHGDRYRAERMRTDLPDLSRRFVCASVVEEELGLFHRAAIHRLHAAWVCDDSDSGDGSADQRAECLRLAALAMKAGQRIQSDPAHQALVLADVARRARMFDRAIELCNEFMPQARPRLRRLLEFQRALAQQQDLDGHTESQSRPGSFDLEAFLGELRPNLEAILGNTATLGPLRTESRWMGPFIGGARVDQEELKEALVILLKDVAAELKPHWALEWMIQEEARRLTLVFQLRGNSVQLENIPRPFPPFDRQRNDPPPGSFLYRLQDLDGSAFPRYQDGVGPGLAICLPKAWGP